MIRALHGGLQYCVIRGERFSIIHKYGYLEKVDQGELVLSETKPREAERLFWVGRTTSTAYWLRFDTTQTIFEVITWLGYQQDMILAHDGEFDFVDVDRQDELLF